MFLGNKLINRFFKNPFITLWETVIFAQNLTLAPSYVIESDSTHSKNA